MSILYNQNDPPIVINKIDISFNEDELNNILYSNDSNDSIGSSEEEKLNTTDNIIIEDSLTKKKKNKEYIGIRIVSDDNQEEYNNDDDTSVEEEDDNDYLQNKKFNIRTPQGNGDYDDVSSETSSIEGFENITLENSQERKHKEYQEQQLQAQQSQSPFKKLLTQKFKSFSLSKDKLDFSPVLPNISSEKYNTFPISSKLFIDQSQQQQLQSNSISSPSTFSSTSNLSTPSSESLSSISSNMSNGVNGIANIISPGGTLSSSSSKDFSPLSIYHINYQSPTIVSVPTPSSIETSLDGHHVNNNINNNNINSSTINSSILLGNTEFADNPMFLSSRQQSFSFSTITRPVLESEKTKVNSKILIFLSLSIFFSVSNLYYTQPLLVDIGKDFGINYSIISQIPMSVQIGYAFGLLFISTTGDIISKKKLILLLSFLTCLCLIGVGLSPHITMMLAFYFLVGLTSIIPNIAIPMAIDLTQPSDRRMTLGVLMSSLFVGLLGSRVISGIIGQQFGWRIMFFIAAIGTFLVNISLLITLPYTPRTSLPIPYSELLSSILKIFKADEILRSSYFIGMCIFAMFSVFWTTLAFRLSEEPFNYSSGFIGLFGLFGMAAAITPLSGKLSERFSQGILIRFYMILCAIGYIVMFFFDSYLVALIVGIFILDMGVQSIHISNQTISHVIHDKQMKSRINQAYLSSYFIGGGIGSTISGFIYLMGGWKGTSILGLVFIGLAYSCHLIFYDLNIFNKHSNSTINMNNIPNNIQEDESLIE